MERDFKGIWIPKEIWEDDKLDATDKIIFAEIDSLDVEGRGCYASNSYLATFCHCTERRVSMGVSKLIQSSYIEQIGFDGRTRILRSRLENFSRQGGNNFQADTKNIPDSLYNNKIDNNIDNNKYKENKAKEKPTLEEVRAYCNERNNGVDAERWYNYYSANGWKVGKNPMKDWKAAVRTWERKTEKPKDVSFDVNEFFERNRKR